MNAVDMLHTAQLPQGHRQLCAAQGAALYQVPNGVASDPYCGADDEQREEQCADGIGDPAVRIELDDQGGQENPYALEEVAENMDDGRSNVDVAGGMVMLGQAVAVHVARSLQDYAHSENYEVKS